MNWVQHIKSEMAIENIFFIKSLVELIIIVHK